MRTFIQKIPLSIRKNMNVYSCFHLVCFLLSVHIYEHYSNLNLTENPLYYSWVLITIAQFINLGFSIYNKKVSMYCIDVFNVTCIIGYIFIAIAISVHYLYGNNAFSIVLFIFSFVAPLVFVIQNLGSFFKVPSSEERNLDTIYRIGKLTGKRPDWFFLTTRESLLFCQVGKHLFNYFGMHYDNKILPYKGIHDYLEESCQTYGELTDDDFKVIQMYLI